MKPVFTRMMAVAVLATSMSAFAASNNPKSGTNDSSNAAGVETATEGNSSMTYNALLEKVDQLQQQVQQLEAKDKQNHADQKARQDEMNKQVRQQEKEWEAALWGNLRG